MITEHWYVFNIALLRMLVTEQIMVTENRYESSRVLLRMLATALNEPVAPNSEGQSYSMEILLMEESFQNLPGPKISILPMTSVT